MRAAFASDLVGPVRTSLDDLLTNFSVPRDQGPSAYAEQMHLDHPELDIDTLPADAVLAVDVFHQRLFGAG